MTKKYGQHFLNCVRQKNHEFYRNIINLSPYYILKLLNNYFDYHIIVYLTIKTNCHPHFSNLTLPQPTLKPIADKIDNSIPHIATTSITYAAFLWETFYSKTLP